MYTPEHLTLWSRPDPWFGQSWYGWYPIVGRSRDSDPVEESNYRRILEDLRKVTMDAGVDNSQNSSDRDMCSVQDVRESHWAVGWVETIMVHESDEKALRLAEEIVCALDGYPVYDEEDWSALEDEQVQKWWGRESHKQRIEWCQDAEESIFAARRDFPSWKVYEALRESL